MTPAVPESPRRAPVAGRPAFLVSALAVCGSIAAGPGTSAPAVPVVSAQAAASVLERLEGFDATSLTGERVGAGALLGQSTILIVTPSRDAAESTRAWAKALREHVSLQQVRVRDLIAIDLPFFMSTQDAMSIARDKIPARYHDITWFSTDATIESAFDIPHEAEQATVLVLGPNGKLRARASGTPTPAKIEEVVRAAKGSGGPD